MDHSRCDVRGLPVPSEGFTSHHISLHDEQGNQLARAELEHEHGYDPEGTAFVQWIDSKHKRQGHASHLLQHLEMSGVRPTWSGQGNSEEGDAFINSYENRRQAAMKSKKASFDEDGECDHEWCHGFPDGWHTKAEHIDPADRDPHSDLYHEVTPKVNDAMSHLSDEGEALDVMPHGPSHLSKKHKHHPHHHEHAHSGPGHIGYGWGTGGLWYCGGGGGCVGHSSPPVSACAMDGSDSSDIGGDAGGGDSGGDSGSATASRKSVGWQPEHRYRDIHEGGGHGFVVLHAPGRTASADRSAPYAELVYAVDHRRHRLFINALHVHEDYRREGLATEMLVTALRQWKGYDVDPGVTSEAGEKWWQQTAPLLAHLRAQKLI